MQGTRIVTAVVFLSLVGGVGCKAKFTHKNAPVDPTASAVGPNAPYVPTTPTPPQPVGPTGPQVGQGPVIPTVPVDEPVLPGPTEPYRPQVQVPPHGGPYPHPAQPVPQLGCPTSGDMSLDPRRVIRKKTVIFKRGRQMIWRKNCDGVVYSKRYENLSGATSKVIRLNATGRGGYVMIFNRTTCDTPSLQAQQILPSRDGSFSFAVSTQPSNMALLVKPGRNLIDYEIPGGEKGTLILTVKVSSSEEDCIVLTDRGCGPRRGAHWTDTVFENGN